MIITNQALRTSALVNDWKKKIPLIAAAVRRLICYVRPWHLILQQLPDVPFRIFAATEKDGFRKPIPGMWYELERIFAEEEVQIGLFLR